MRIKLILLTALIGLAVMWVHSDKNENEVAVESMTLGGENGFHYAIPHGSGDERENPTNGCPCITLALGWSSYAIKTNAIAHGVYSLFDAFAESQSNKEDGPVRIIDIYEFEKQLVKKWEGGGK